MNELFSAQRERMLKDCPTDTTSVLDRVVGAMLSEMVLWVNGASPLECGDLPLTPLERFQLLQQAFVGARVEAKHIAELRNNQGCD